MIVTFCGHREIANVGRVREWLNNVCIQLIDDGASEFFLGGYGAFDRLCADVLRDFFRALRKRQKDECAHREADADSVE